MMGPRSTFAVAAGISVILHGALVLMFSRVEFGFPHVSWAEENKPRKPAPVVPKPKTPELEPKEETPEFRMGDASGTGFALQDVDAPIEAIAPEADSDQALLS